MKTRSLLFTPAEAGVATGSCGLLVPASQTTPASAGTTEH